MRTSAPALLLSGLLTALAPAPPLTAAEPFVSELFAELNRARAERNLPALGEEVTLDGVASRRAGAMAAEGWFGLVSPAGRRVEDELDAAGYSFRLVAEKLVRSGAGARALVDEWRLRPHDQLQSLFHPGVTRIGIGVAASAGGQIVDLVLATPMEAAAATTLAPFDARERESGRAELGELVRAARKEAKLRPLRSDPLLAQAAQAHAEALLAALANGKGVGSIELLADRLSEIEARRTAGGSELVKSKDAFSGREISVAPRGRPLHGDLLSAIVDDTRSAAVAFASLAGAEGRPLYLEPQMARLGVGIAAAPPESGGKIVWVVATQRQ